MPTTTPLSTIHVQPGDVIDFGGLALTVKFSEPASDFTWHIEGFTPSGNVLVEAIVDNDTIMRVTRES